MQGTSNLMKRASEGSTRSSGWVAAVVAATFLLSSCGEANQPPQEATATNTQPAENKELASAVESLCLARDEAQANPEEARTTFLDRAHGPLHLLAERVQEVDRTLAAEVLESKQKVERDLNTKDAGSLPGDLDRLTTAAGKALEKLDMQTPKCAT